MKTLALALFALTVGCKNKEPAPAAGGSGSASVAAPVEGSAAAPAARPAAPPAPPTDPDCQSTQSFKLDACVRLCGAGNGNGCYLAGQAWLVGDQVPDADEAKAQAYFTKGCELGDAFACKWLAPMYAKGLGGVAQDPGKAEELTAKAVTLYAPLCAKGDAQACYDLSTITKDPKQKEDAAKKACDLGKHAACDAAK